MKQDKAHIFKQIYDGKFNNLVIYSVDMGVPFEQAKDLVQDCYIRLWENFSKIDAPTPYLFRAVRNSSLNFISSSEHKMKSRHVSLGNIHHDTHDDEDARNAIEYFHQLENAYERLMNLTGRSREAFTMVYMHKMKIKDVAAELDVSENTVKTYLKRAKEALRLNSKEMSLLFALMMLNA